MYQIRWLDNVSDILLESAATAEPRLRDRIIAALADVEQLLTNEPDTAGESREPGTRFLLDPPLADTFKVNARLREVLVIRAKIVTGKSH
jgi:hypothetical protein